MNIHAAIERGKIDVVLKLLRDDPLLIHSRSPSNDQPLHIAAWQKRRKMLELLLDAGADVNAHGFQGKTPLHYAVLSDSKPIVELLIRKGADIRQVNDAGVTPIYLAASTENRKLIDAFLRLTKSVDIASGIYIDGPESILARLEKNPQLLHAIPQFENLIWDAIRVESIGLTQFLLQHGVNPNCKAHGTYPLLDAIAHNNLELVRLLLDNSGDVSIRDHVGRSVLKYCEVHGASPPIIDLLKSRGAL